MPFEEVLCTDGVPVRIWTPVSEVEGAAMDNLRNVARLPWVFHHVAVMPDVHHGKGSTVGSVVAMKNALAPAAVGVDIGCGMGAIRTTLRASDLPDSLRDLRLGIERHVPVGFNSHQEPPSLSEGLEKQAVRLFARFDDLDGRVSSLRKRALCQLGTLGGGNHFIEICLDEDEDPRVWIMLHSGSRNIGKELAEIHIEIARKLTHNEDLPDPDLGVFLAGTPQMQAYRRDLFWAQEYAYLNRLVMFYLCKKVVGWAIPVPKGQTIGFDIPILCHHNYVAEEFHFGEEVLVTRKGAISAGFGEMGIIPGSMGSSSYIVQGLGNPWSFKSASHGAGRRMSRGAARRKFTVNDLEEQTRGIECRKDADIIDEIPAAYKDIDQVMRNQEDLVKIIHRLRQVVCVKG